MKHKNQNNLRYWHTYFILLLFLTSSFVIKAQEVNVDCPTYESDSSSIFSEYGNPTTAIDSILQVARQYLKKPYNYRPTESVRFDCSGFTSFVFGQFGYKLKRSSYEQAEQFTPVPVDKLKAGDLVFYSGRRNNGRVGHVGIVVKASEDGKFEFIHSTNHGGILISRSHEDYYVKRYIKAGRVIDTELSDTAQNIATNVTLVEPDNTSNIKTLQSEEKKEIRSNDYHIVQKGDTLYSISRRYGIKLNELKKINNIVGDKIMPKQKLKIFAPLT